MVAIKAVLEQRFINFAAHLKKIFTFIFLPLLIAIGGCQSNQVLNSFYEIEHNVWSYDQTIKDSVVVGDDGFFHQLNINLRVKGDYAYSNLYVRIGITNPESEKHTFSSSLVLADKFGKWKGSGLGEKITFQIPLENRKYFTKKGTYYLELEQFMRIEKLQDVNAVGFKIIKQEEIY